MTPIVLNQFRPVIDGNLFLQEESQLYEPSSERAVLALIVQRPDLLMEIERQVPLDWFFIDMHMYIYRIMSFIGRQCAMHGWPLAFDAVTVHNIAMSLGGNVAANFRHKTNGMEKWNGVAEFAKHVSIDALPRHLGTLRNVSIRVGMFRLMRAQQVEFARGANRDLEPSFGSLLCGVERIRESHSVSPQEDLAEAADKVLYDKGNARIVKCAAYPIYSDLIGGFRPGTVTIMSGRSKAGKSKVVAMSSLGFASSEIQVLFLDSELDCGLVGYRQLCMTAGMGDKELKDPANTEATDAARAKLAEWSKFIEYRNINGLSFDQVVMLIQNFRRRIGPDARCVVIYDWMRVTDQNNGRIPEHIALGEMTSQVQQVAKRCSLPIIAVSQHNRNALGATQSEMSEGGEAFIGGSDRIVQLASAVCHVRKVDPELEEAILANYGYARFTHILQIDVNRHGPSHRAIPLISGEDDHRMDEAGEECFQFLKRFSASRKKVRKPKEYGGPRLPANLLPGNQPVLK